MLDDFVSAAGLALGSTLRGRIEELAPPPPFWLPQTEEGLRRWVGAAFVAAGIALHQSADDPAAAGAFAFVTARVLYGDPTFTT
jgi:hypothetical protein